MRASHPGGLAGAFDEAEYGTSNWQAFGDIAKDSNVDQILKITAQFSVANAAVNIGAGLAFVEGCN